MAQTSVYHTSPSVPIDAYVTPRTSYFDTYPEASTSTVPHHPHPATRGIRVRRSRAALRTSALFDDGSNGNGKDAAKSPSSSSSSPNSSRSRSSTSHHEARPSPHVRASSAAQRGSSAVSSDASSHLPATPDSASLSPTSPDRHSSPHSLVQSPSSVSSGRNGSTKAKSTPPRIDTSTRQSASVPLPGPSRTTSRSGQLRRVGSVPSIVPFPRSPVPTMVDEASSDSETEDLFAGPRTSVYYDSETGELKAHSPNVNDMYALVGTLKDLAMPPEARNMKWETREAGRLLELRERELEQRARMERRKEEKRRSSRHEKKHSFEAQPERKEVGLGLNVSIADHTQISSPPRAVLPSTPASVPGSSSAHSLGEQSSGSSRYDSVRSIQSLETAASHLDNSSSESSVTGSNIRPSGSWKSLTSISEHTPVVQAQSEIKLLPCAPSRILSIDEIVAKHSASIRRSSIPIATPVKSVNAHKPFRSSTNIPTIDEIVQTHSPKLHSGQWAARPREKSTESTKSEESSSPPDGHRSSLDSIADEVMQTLRMTGHEFLDFTLTDPTRPKSPEGSLRRGQGKAKPKALHHARSFPNRPSSRNSIVTSRSVTASAVSRVQENLKRTGMPGHTTRALSFHGRPGSPKEMPTVPDPDKDLAHYLRSARLTILLKLKKPPNEHLTVSLADVGAPSGHPVIVFLGLGCVRYLIALYDEVADALGLRLICVDRWGLGKTSDIPDNRRGFLEWSTVVEEVADQLNLTQFSILAHSAGAPYALATSLRLDDRVHGSIHLLAPWVSTSAQGGSNNGYKWLKYVPNSMIRTAQAAEWKMHGWLLGKPPTLQLDPVSYDVTGSFDSPEVISPTYDDPEGLSDEEEEEAAIETPSTLVGSRIERSRRTSGVSEWSCLSGETQEASRTFTSNQTRVTTSFRSTSGRKNGFLGKVLTRSKSPNGSDGGRSSSTSCTTSPTLPSTPKKSNGFGVGYRPSSVTGSNRGASLKRGSYMSTTTSSTLSSSKESYSTRPTSPTLSATYLNSTTTISPPPNPSLPFTSTSSTSVPQLLPPKTDLGTALLKASFAESLRGGTSDLLAILERTDRPWGFSYVDVEVPVKVWHGDRDDKISLQSVQWMENAMPKCSVQIVQGADHSMMTNVQVMMEILESISDEWKQ